MHQVYFLFVGEGTSDNTLVDALEKLCILCGAKEAQGTAVDWHLLPGKVPRALAGRVKAALEMESTVNLVFVHRDADATDPMPRQREIRNALEQVTLEIPGVPVVPIRETEAWLLLDEEEIRRVAGNPRGRMDLALPALGKIESIGDPKTLLQETLSLASGLRGHRLREFKKSFPRRRRLLLERLDPAGQINELSAWQELRRTLHEVLEALRGT